METVMPDFDPLQHHDEEQRPPSKSQLKREADQLQQLGKRIAALRPDQREKLPLGERLRSALDEYNQIDANGAKRRQLQFIGKLMRTADADAIRAVLERFDSATAAHNQLFHQLEQWRERLLSEDDTALQQFIAAHPEAEIQHLRQLVRNAKRERQLGKPPVNGRKLFQYLRQLSET
jgi:ribosome-associated protein